MKKNKVRIGNPECASCIQDKKTKQIIEVGFGFEEVRTMMRNYNKGLYNSAEHQFVLYNSRMVLYKELLKQSK